MKVAKEINFLPDYVLDKHVKAKKKALGVLWSLIFILVVVGLYFVPKLMYHEFERQEAKVKKELVEYDSVQKKITTLAQIQENKNKKQSSLDKINKKQVRQTELLNKITSSIPANIKLKTYSITDRDISMSFTIATPIDTIELIRSLENMGIFEKVSINTLPIVDMYYTVNFKLKLK